MNCRQIQDLLDLVIDKEINDSDQKKLDDHLQNCATCSDFYDDALELQKTLGEISVKDPGDQYHRETAELIFSKTINSRDNSGQYSDQILSETKVTFSRSLATFAASLVLFMAALYLSGGDSNFYTKKIDNNQKVFVTASINEAIFSKGNRYFSDSEKKQLAEYMFMQVPSGILGRTAILHQLNAK